MASFPFLSLPKDVAVEILTHLDSPSDLRSMLLVSRSFNALFRSVEHIILKSTIQNGIHAEVLVDAVAACRIPPPISELDPPVKMFRAHDDFNDWLAETSMRAARETDRKDALAKAEFDTFVAKHRRWQAGEESIGRLDLPLCRSMCRLWATVNVFTESFFSEAAGRFYRHVEANGLGGFPSQHSSSGPVSPSTFSASTTPSRLEKARIQRAFFRFEIIRRLFGPRNSYKGWRETLLNTNGADETTSILADYTMWEISEIRVVLSYVRGVWAQRLFRLSREAIEDAGKLIEQKGLGPTKVSWSEWEAMKHDCSRTDYSRLDVYSPSKPFHYMAGLGLPFLRKWLKLSPRDALSIASTYQKYSELDSRASIDSMITFTGNVIAERKARRKDGDLSPSVSTTELKSPGWFVEMYESEMGHERVYHYDNFQSLGFSFWDRDRFERAELSNLTLAELRPFPQDDLASHFSDPKDLFTNSRHLLMRYPMVSNDVARDLMPEPLIPPKRRSRHGTESDVDTTSGRHFRTVEDIMGDVEY